MLSLCIDTAYKYLTVALIKDDEIIASLSNECFKRQSEEVFVALDELFKNANVSKTDIDSMCISEGPGSYTGVRIAMTVAKVLCKVKELKLYKISTLKLYAGNKEKVMVIMDARANRAYVGCYDKGSVLMEDCVLPVESIDVGEYNLILDGELVGKENNYPDIPKCFLDTKKDWEEVEEINFLVPKYLKESNEYFR